MPKSPAKARPKAKSGAKSATKSSGGGEIRETSLAKALSERYLAYALSTIMARSLPDVRDGLKPVHRRLLYAMRQLKLDPDQGFKKCARVVGDVIGKFHPHGDAAVYDALVRLAQDFAQRYPLVDGQGNFGNIDGDNAAAMRYTEARMTAVAHALMEGIDEDAVDFRDTYDGEDCEPVVLPAGFPNLLANGSAGIAVGMATSIPPHNAHEICAALLHLIKFPNATAKKLVELIPGPDFPTGGVLVEPESAIVEAYKTGRGGFRLRARWQEEKLAQGRYQIVVDEIPYQVQKARLIEKVAELLHQKKLPILADIRDESAADLRIVLEPKSRGVEPAMLMEQLFRLTDLEVRIGLNMNVLDATNTPGVMSLRDCLLAFLNHREEVLVRRTKFRLEKIEIRLEILGGLLACYLNLDRVLEIIRNEDEPKPLLIKAFKLSDRQAEAIFDMRLRQLRKLEENKIRAEEKALATQRSSLRGLLRDKSRRRKVVAAEISEIRKQFGPKTKLGARRTSIGKPPEAQAMAVAVEAMIEREPITVLCSEKGWIRVARGHLASISETKYKEGDQGKFFLHAQTTDKLIIFATNGRFYTLGCGNLPAGRGHGEPLRLMIEMDNGHDIVKMFIHQAGRRLITASDKGRGFIVEEADVVAHTRNGRQVLNLAAGEEAAAVAVIPEGADRVAVVGQNAKLLIFPLAEVPVMSRGRGVILQRYHQGGLSDIQAFKLAGGMAWRTGRGLTIAEKTGPWLGKRAGAGLKAPRGFPKNNRFG